MLSKSSLKGVIDWNFTFNPKISVGSILTESFPFSAKLRVEIKLMGSFFNLVFNPSGGGNFGLLGFEVEEFGEDFEQAIFLEYFQPQVTSQIVAIFAQGIACAVVVSLVEREKMSTCSS